jgi:hypothetical protein
MTADRANERLSLRGRQLPPAYEVREIGLEPGCVRAYDEAEWRDALVVVECGEIELECVRGSRTRFRDGAVLWLVGLPLRAIHNCGCEPTLLVAVSRRQMTIRPRPNPTRTQTVARNGGGLKEVENA